MKAGEFELTVHLLSDIGCHRGINEDSVLSVLPRDPRVRDRRGVLVVVADGMGGHSAGEVASHVAVDALHRAYYGGAGDEPTLAESMQRANKAVYEMAAADSALTGMGTTCTAIVVRGGHAQCAHVGDTRLYLLRGDEIYQMTEDHSAVRSLVASGALQASEAQHHADRNVILRAVGTRPTVEITTWEHPFPIRHGDRFVLCTDGLHDLVEAAEIKRIASERAGAAACEAMVGLAKSRGGFDNITVALIDVAQTTDGEAESAPPTRTMQVPL